MFFWLSIFTILAFGLTLTQAHNGQAPQTPPYFAQILTETPPSHASEGPIDMDVDVQEVHLTFVNPRSPINLKMTSFLSDWWIVFYHTGFEKNGHPAEELELNLEKTLKRPDGQSTGQNEDVEKVPFLLADGPRGQAEIQLGLGIGLNGKDIPAPGTYTSVLVLNGTDGFARKEQKLKIFLHVPSFDEVTYQVSESDLEL